MADPTQLSLFIVAQAGRVIAVYATDADAAKAKAATAGSQDNQVLVAVPDFTGRVNFNPPAPQPTPTP